MRRTLVVLIALAVTASAEETLTPRDLDGASWGARRGETLVLDGKFEDYSFGELRLAKVGREKLAVDPDSALAAELAKLRAGGERLEKRRSNVRVTGVACDIEETGRALRVSKVAKLPDDVPAFAERARLAGSDLTALAREARERAREFGESDLAEWARATFEQALDARRALVAKASEALALARDYRELAQVTSKAISVLGAHAEDAQVQAELERLGAVQHRGEWLSRDELRARLGLVLSGGKWVTKLHAELEDEIGRERARERERAASLRSLPDSAYETAANQKRLATGMLKQEAAVAKGFPKGVERLTDERGVSWDQWLFADGTRAYFVRRPGEESLLASWR